MGASFLIVALQLGPHVGVTYGLADVLDVLVRFDCVVGGDVRGGVWVFVPSMKAVELGFDSIVATKHTFDRRRVGFADSFAVPAGAFRVEFLIHFLVGFACPFEGGRQGCLLDFVVVVDKACSFDHCVSVVIPRRELVRVPCQIDIESRDGGLVRVTRDYIHVAGVLFDKTSHGRGSGW